MLKMGENRPVNRAIPKERRSYSSVTEAPVQWTATARSLYLGIKINHLIFTNEGSKIFRERQIIQRPELNCTIVKLS